MNTDRSSFGYDHGEIDFSNVKRGRWTEQEQVRFAELLQVHGKEWKRIADIMQTRTVVQVRTHAQKYFKRLAKNTGTSMVSTSKKQGLFLPKHLDYRADETDPGQGQKHSRSKDNTGKKQAKMALPKNIFLKEVERMSENIVGVLDRNQNLHDCCTSRKESMDDNEHNVQPLNMNTQLQFAKGVLNRFDDLDDDFKNGTEVIELVPLPDNGDVENIELIKRSANSGLSRPSTAETELSGTTDTNPVDSANQTNDQYMQIKGKKRKLSKKRRWSSVTPRTMAAATILAAPTMPSNGSHGNSGSSNSNRGYSDQLQWALDTLESESRKLAAKRKNDAV